MRQSEVQYSWSLTLVVPMLDHVGDSALRVDAMHAGNQAAKDRSAACPGDSV